MSAADTADTNAGTAERQRLAEPTPATALAGLGAVPGRARVGHRPRGLQRARRGLGLLPARPRAVAGLPVERGRHGRGLRRGADVLPGLALWNGVDPILKERMFGLSGPEGNHGEDVKECWWYLDATPDALVDDAGATTTRSGRSPTSALVAENGRAAGTSRSSSSSTPGVFDDDRYWCVTVDYAKAGPDDLCMRITGREPRARRRDAARAADALVPQHLGVGLPGEDHVPRIAADGDAVAASPSTPASASWPSPDGPAARRCSATTRPTRSGCGASPAARRTPRTASTTTSCTAPPPSTRRATGTKGALRYRLDGAGGRRRDVRLRLRPGSSAGAPADRAPAFDDVVRGAAGRGRRLPRRPHPARHDRRRGARAAPGAGRDDVGQAVLPLRRRPLARRRPGRAAPARGAVAAAATPSGAT